MRSRAFVSRPRCSPRSCIAWSRRRCGRRRSAQWLAIVALGIGPVGAAFYVWDIGMKRGDIRVLGAASYATPLLSTAFLILAGYAQPTATIAIAAVLIAGGGLIAAKDMVWRKPCRVERSETRHLTARMHDGFAALCPSYEDGSQPFGASSNFANSNPARRCSRPASSRRCSRPPASLRRHDRLRPFAGGEIGAELHARCAARRRAMRSVSGAPA